MSRTSIMHAVSIGFIIALSLLLRLRDITATGIQHDAALNSMRAVGWFDFLVGVGQSSPLVWLGYIPWWGNLSFHDHPPLVFAIQHIFFRVFGDSSLVALLPPALVGTATAIVLYMFLKARLGRWHALIAMFAFAVSSYAVWMSRTGYLEGVEVFFITLSFCMFVRYFETRDSKTLIGWALATGAALLSKYTALFLIPAAIASLLIIKNVGSVRRLADEPKRLIIRHTHASRETDGSDYKSEPTQKFWFHSFLAAAILLAVLSPVIVYNVYVFHLRGHFDAAISSMLGMYPEDYAVLSYRSVAPRFWENIPLVVSTLRANMSLPFFLLAIISMISVFVKAMRREKNPLMITLAIHLTMLIIMFSFSGVSDRFLPIMMPFVSISIVLGIAGSSVTARLSHIAVRDKLRRYTLIGKGVVIAVLIMVGVTEILYSFNTNITRMPFGSDETHYARARIYENGFESLDTFLRDNAYGSLPPLRRITRLSHETQTQSIRDREIILFDERANWFSRVWYVDRYKYYYQVPVVYFSDLSADAEARGMGAFEYLRAGGAKGFWIVLAQGAGKVNEVDEEYEEQLDNLQRELEELKVAPVEIKDYTGEVVFRVYHL